MFKIFFNKDFHHFRIISHPVDPKIEYNSRGQILKNSFHFSLLQEMVADAGFEPASPSGREILSLVCIPVPPISHTIIISLSGANVKNQMSRKCQTRCISSSKKNR